MAMNQNIAEADPIMGWIVLGLTLAGFIWMLWKGLR
jgi:hypothetical protein